MFHSRRRFFLKQANIHNMTKTWAYQWDAVFANWSRPYQGGEYFLLSWSKLTCTVVHGSDAMYLFSPLSPALGQTPADLSAAQAMMSYFVNFAVFGDPNGPTKKQKEQQQQKATRRNNDGTPCVTVPDIGFNTYGAKDMTGTFWPAYGSNKTIDMVQFRPGNVSVIQDNFRANQMAVFDRIEVSAGLLFKRDD
jgi:hypothetical protein